MKAPPIADPRVKAAYDAIPAKLRAPLLKLRRLIFEAAVEADVGDLIETLKWNEPAYLPAKPRVGTTVRLNAVDAQTSAALFHCQTTLLATFRAHYPKTFGFDGDRALLFKAGADIPEAAFKHCAALALTYHRKPARA